MYFESVWFPLKYIVLLTLTVTAFIANILVIFSVLLNRRLRRAQKNFILTSLAIADLLFSVLVMPFGLLYELLDGYQNRFWFCQIWISCEVYLTTTAILNLLLISLDRYLAISRPLDYLANSYHPKRIIFVILLTWALALSLSFPTFLIFYDEDEEDNPHPGKVEEGSFTDLNPGQDWSGEEEQDLDEIYARKNLCFKPKIVWYELYTVMASFYLPLLVIVIVSVKIFILVVQREKSDPNATSSAADIDSHLHLTTLSTSEDSNNPTHRHLVNQIVINARKDQLKQAGRLVSNKGSRILGVTMAIFVIAWFPYFSLFLINIIAIKDGNEDENAGIPDWILRIFLWIGYSRCSINPIIYGLLNPDFRHSFKEILCCRCSKLISSRHHHHSPGRRVFYAGEEEDMAHKHAEEIHEIDRDETSVNL